MRRLLSKQSKRVRILTLLDLAGLATVFFLLSERFPNRGDMFLNLFSEMAGAFVTYILLVLILERTEDVESEKARLIAEMGSSVKDVVIAAVEKLGQRGWLTDGSLQRADLGGGNLQRADLMLANLQEADLILCNLQGATLTYADLQGADLRDANLYGAHLGHANMQRANLKSANLQWAVLGANSLDQGTTLPDGTKWTPDTDMARFTDPDHPDFWRSDRPDSPAYLGKA